MSHSKIRLDGRYRYRNGEEARILCIDRPHEKFKVISMSEKGILEFHDEAGLCDFSNLNHLYDLIEVKEKKITWVGIDDEGYCEFWRTKDAAYKYKNNNMAIIKIEYEEGQFDE